MKSRLSVLALLGLVQTQVQAQIPVPASTPSRIDEVVVYPGSAQVTRLASVPAGARELVLNCLSARFDAESLQIDAPPGVNLGPVQVETLPRERQPACAAGPLEDQIRQLEDQRNALQAEYSALDASVGYLKALGSGEARATPAAAISGTADTIRRAAQEALLKQAQNRRQQEALDKQLAPLLGDRDRLAQANPQWRSLRLRLSTAKEAEIRLSYRVPQAGWAPGYRALLDTASASLSIERLAQVSQQSGEDWTNVRLRLSTAQPRQNLALNPPWPWTLDIAPPTSPMAADARVKGSRAMALAAPAPVAASVAPPPPPEPELERFDTSVFQGSFATEFTLPQRVSIASSTQRASLALGVEKFSSRLLARVQPQQEAAAYLLAEMPKPAGAWPRGALQLVRDGAFVGSSTLNVADGREKLEIPFGRDESLRVLAPPQQRSGANTGFIGARVERRYGRAYTVENRHGFAVTLQLIEAAPLAQHEDIKVQTQFSPTPTTLSWRDQPGLVLWEQPLPAGATQKFTADYVISAPKDAPVTGWQ